jgi:hypothetical protein
MPEPQSSTILGTIDFSKVLNELPTVLVPNMMYLVLNDQKVYIWVSNDAGTMAYPLKTLSDNQTDEVFSAMLNTVSTPAGS